MSRVIHKASVPIYSGSKVRLPFSYEITGIEHARDSGDIEFWYAFDPAAGGYESGATHSLWVAATGEPFEGVVIGTVRSPADPFVWHLIDERSEA